MQIVAAAAAAACLCLRLFGSASWAVAAAAAACLCLLRFLIFLTLQSGLCLSLSGQRLPIGPGSLAYAGLCMCMSAWHHCSHWVWDLHERTYSTHLHRRGGVRGFRPLSSQPCPTASAQLQFNSIQLQLQLNPLQLNSTHSNPMQPTTLQLNPLQLNSTPTSTHTNSTATQPTCIGVVVSRVSTRLRRQFRSKLHLQFWPELT